MNTAGLFNFYSTCQYVLVNTALHQHCKILWDNFYSQLDKSININLNSIQDILASLLAITLFKKINACPLSVHKLMNAFLINAIQYTLTGHLIRYTLQVPGWTHFCLQNCLNSLWHRFPTRCRKHSSEILVHSDMVASRSCCRFVGYTFMMRTNLPFHHIPKVLYWIEIWWLWRPFE